MMFPLEKIKGPLYVPTRHQSKEKPMVPKQQHATEKKIRYHGSSNALEPLRSRYVACRCKVIVEKTRKKLWWYATVLVIIPSTHYIHKRMRHFWTKEKAGRGCARFLAGRNTSETGLNRDELGLCPV